MKGRIGTPMIIERPEKKKKLKKNERFMSSNYRCPQCGNTVKKYTKMVDNKAYCLRCFSNYNKKVEMV
jgi:uncharacterized paraquat-inducible protein A